MGGWVWGVCVCVGGGGGTTEPRLVLVFVVCARNFAL